VYQKDITLPPGEHAIASFFICSDRQPLVLSKVAQF